MTSSHLVMYENHTCPLCEGICRLYQVRLPILVLALVNILLDSLRQGLPTSEFAMTRLTDSVVAPWPDAETLLAVSSEWSSQNPLSGRGGFGSVFSNFEKDTVESDLQWSSQISRSQNSMIEEIIEGDL